MSLKSVVKVMNFHSLLRVDSSRKSAKKYTKLEDVLTDMIDNITNNRNIVLDSKTLKVDPNKPILTVYIGTDMGFCNNLNTLVNGILKNDDEQKKIIVGRKIHVKPNDPNVLMRMTREDFDADHEEIIKIIEDGINHLTYSQINIVYNHYYNSSEVDIMNKKIFPLEKKKNINAADYNYDFVCEGDINKLLVELVVLYARYQIEIAASTSSAAENIARQNVTTESLKRIDEREEDHLQSTRRVQKDKQFAKVLDNYTKINNY